MAFDVGARGAEETAMMLTKNFSTIAVECQAEEYIRIYQLLRYDPLLTLLNICASNKGPGLINVLNAEGATTVEPSALRRHGEMARHRASKRKSEPVLSMPLDALIWHKREDGAVVPADGLKHPVCAVKVDVQGHELPVLQGLSETLRRYRPVVYWEFELRLGPTAFGPLPFLESLGYACVPNERIWHKSGGLMPCSSGICDVTCAVDMMHAEIAQYLERWMLDNGGKRHIADRYKGTRRNDGRTASSEEREAVAAARATSTSA